MEEVGLPVTYCLKCNVLNLAFKSLPFSSVRSMNQTACLDDLQSIPGFLTTPEMYSPSQFSPSLPCSFPYDKTGILPFGVFLTCLHLPLDSPDIPLISLSCICDVCLPTWPGTLDKHGLLSHSLYRHVNITAVSTNACQTWLFRYLWLFADGLHKNIITIRIIEKRKLQNASSTQISIQS